MTRPSIARRVAYAQFMSIMACNSGPQSGFRFQVARVPFRRDEPTTYKAACRVAAIAQNFSRRWIAIPAAWAYVPPRGTEAGDGFAQRWGSV